MNSNGFVEVFDVARTGFRDWSFPAFGLIFVAIGVALFFGPSVIRGMGIPYFKFPSKFRTIFSVFYVGFAAFWVGITFFATYSSYARHRHLADTNRCSTVEGPVENFTPMPYSGHADETFSVSGVNFSYSDYGITDAFNNTESHGGPIHANSYVRICYDPQDHAILRLAIKGFRGKAPDYSATVPPFPSEPNKQPEPVKPVANQGPPYWEWLGNLWMAMWVANAVAILRLFVPYLRMFWKVGTIDFESLSIPAWLPRNRRYNLRNSIALWKDADGEIWLRPRGFNFVRVGNVVAKLVTNGDRIVGAEVRYSSGLPIIYVLFFISAFLLFSQSMPGGDSFRCGIYGLLSSRVSDHGAGRPEKGGRENEAAGFGCG